VNTNCEYVNIVMQIVAAYFETMCLHSPCLAQKIRISLFRMKGGYFKQNIRNKGARLCTTIFYYF